MLKLSGVILLVYFIQGCGHQEVKTIVPEAFLSVPLEKGFSFHITQGWEYGDDERVIHPDIKTHFAVDFAAERGTPVYAAADGFAIASYHLAYIGEWQGKRIGFGLGKFVQIWHPNAGVFTAYCHLENIADTLTDYFIAPEERQSEQGIIWYPVIVNRPLAEIIPLSKEVKKGELIGYIGDTGLSWDYDETPDLRPDPLLNPTWDPAGTHLHFEVYDRGEDGNKKNRYDPFDLYVEAERYQNADGTLNSGQTPLWMLDESERPRFAR